MQFKYPELLYALLLLLIPIIVHLFQLRRFKEISFTNVAFLKEVSMQTRKSSQIKKWLTLLTRLLLIACIVLAFAQPFTSKSGNFNQEREVVIYLDNSFSLQAKGAQGELLKRAIQDLITEFPQDEEFTLFTNTNTYRNTTIKAIKNDLLKTDYSSNQLGYAAVQLKATKFFNNRKNTLRNFIMVSDFQQKNEAFELIEDTSLVNKMVQLRPINTSNVYVDSIYISKINTNSLKLEVSLKNTGVDIDNLPISLFDDGNLLAKTSVTLQSEASAQFDLPVTGTIDGSVVLNDGQLQFDNELFFNINTSDKINVLSINGEGIDDSFLNRIYSKDEFKFSSAPIKLLNYSDISSQNLVVLNEIKIDSKFTCYGTS